MKQIESMGKAYSRRNHSRERSNMGNSVIHIAFGSVKEREYLFQADSGRFGESFVR